MMRWIASPKPEECQLAGGLHPGSFLEMKVKNHEQVIKVHKDDIRALGILPRDVEVVAVIVPDNSSWTPEVKEYLFLHIKSTVSFERPPRSPLCIEGIYDFYDRYINLRRDWATKLEHDLGFFSQTGIMPHWEEKK
jgi:hypothetical protein